MAASKAQKPEGTISELIEQLQEIRKQHGNIPARVQSLTHMFLVEPVVREGPVKYVLLNS